MVEKSLITNGIDEFARTERTHLVPISAVDKELYFSIINAALAKTDEQLTDLQCAEIWRIATSNDAATFMVWDNCTGDCVGYCQYKCLKTSNIEIGIELRKEYQGVGYGYEICTSFCEKFFELTDVKSLFYCVAKDNERSIRLAKKLNGEFAGYALMAADFDELLEDKRSLQEQFSIVIFEIKRPK